MVLREADVDSIRNRVADGRIEDVARLKVEGATLGAVLELAVAWAQWRAERRAEAESIIQTWAQRAFAVREAFGLLTADPVPCARVSDFAAPEGELYAIRSPEDLTDVRGLLFQERFERSLRGAGFSREVGLGLVGAFAEMADNIVQHSGSTSHVPAAGVVGYQVRSRWMCFAAADFGQGVLASLRRNERWHRMQNDEEALIHAVQHGATSRETALTGNGFAEVHRALADRWGRLRFRSGRACLSLDGAGTARVSTVKSCDFLMGFQLSVSCSLDGRGEVMPFFTASGDAG